jgi:hypothetical protein
VPGVDFPYRATGLLFIESPGATRLRATGDCK